MRAAHPTKLNRNVFHAINFYGRAVMIGGGVDILGGLVFILLLFSIFSALLSFLIQMTTKESAFCIYVSCLGVIFLGGSYLIVNSSTFLAVVWVFLVCFAAATAVFGLVSVLTRRINRHRPGFVEFYIRSEIKDGMGCLKKPTVVFREILQRYSIAEVSDLEEQFSVLYPDADRYLVSFGFSNWKPENMDAAADSKLDEIIHDVVAKQPGRVMGF